MASAKKIRDEIMTMTIVVNSNPAQQEIYQLTKRNRELTEQSTKLREERRKVGIEMGKESAEYKKLTKEIEDNSLSITANKRRMIELADTLDINDMSVKQLRQELSALRRELDRVVPGSEQYNALQVTIGDVTRRLADVRSGASSTSNDIDSLASTFEEYGGTIAVVVGVITGYVLVIQELIDKNNQMADAMSAVEKTTGMTKEEVKGLSEAFTDFDTRTKKLDLLKIAEVGGRLGVAKEEILDFTREIDKAYVALGDSWNGGVDNLADSLGKVASLYKETKDLPIAESINQIGSALNELAAQGASSEQNITDFVNRLGSMPPAMKPPLNTLLAFGSALEESGVNAEIGSSGFAKFVRVASSNATGFAKVMNEPVAKVKELINSDPAEFFLQFSQGLRGLDAEQLSRVLESLKLNDNEVQRVIGAATEKTERFRASMEVANEAVAEGTSLTDEFNKVNNNAAAIYEKIVRKFNEKMSSNGIASFLASAVEAFGQFLGVVDDANGAMTWYRNTLLLLIKIVLVSTATFFGLNLVMGTYNALLKDAYTRVLGLTVVEKTRNLITAASNGLTTLYTASLMLMSAGYNLVTGNTVRATAAIRLFNITLAANPIGAIVTLVTLLASAYFLLQDNTKDAANAVEELNIAQKMSKSVTDAQSESVGELKSKIEPLISVLKDEKSQLSDRKKAYEDLIKLHPEFKGTLDAEFRATDKLTSVYDSLIAKIKEAAKVRALQALLDDEYKKREKLQSQVDIIEETNTKNNPTTTATINGKKVEFKGTVNPANESKLNILNNIADQFNDKLKQADSNIDAITKKMAEPAGEDKSKYNVPDPEGEKAAKDAEKLRKKQEREAEKARKLKEKHDADMAEISKKRETADALEVQLKLEAEDAKIAIMEEGYDKEIALINQQEQRKAAEFDKKKIGNTEIDLLQEKIDKAVGDDKKLFQALMNSWVDNNKLLDDLKLNNIAVFEAKRKAALAKAETENLKDQDEVYQKNLAQLNRQKNDELAQFKSVSELKKGLQGRISAQEMAQIKTWQDGKEALNKVYQKKEIDLHVAHLQSMISLYEGLDMTILNEDQQKQVFKFLDEAKTKISELKAKAAETGQSEKDGLKAKTKLGNQGSTDILGMSIGDWETFFSNMDTGANKLGTISAAVGALQNAFSTYYSYVQQKEQAQMKQVDTNAKKKELRLKKMLDSGQINQEQYEAAVQRLNQETELEKYKLEYDAAKRNRNYMIAQTHANTAMAIMNIWATSKNPWVAAAMSIVVGALGLFQVANIAKQPLPEAPGFQDGFGMTYDMQREQDGKTYSVVRKPLRSGPVYRPTHFIAGEGNKVEMVIDNKTYKGFTPGFRKVLNQEIAYSRGSQGFEGGHYPYLQNNQSGDSGVLVEVIERNTEAYNKVANMKPRAYVVKDMDSAKNTIEMIEEYNAYKKSAEK